MSEINKKTPIIVFILSIIGNIILFIYNINYGVIFSFALSLIIFIYITLLISYKLKSENDYLIKKNQELIDKQELFKNIFEQTPLGISFGNIDNKIIDANKRFQEIVGRSKEELALIDWKIITHPDDVQEDLDLFRDFVAGKIKKYNLEKRYLKKDGSSVWVDMKIIPISISSNSSVTHICIIEDLSEIKNQEEQVLYLNNFDPLTGLHNRHYFKFKKDEINIEENLPISVIIGDINGLKLINEALGHAHGDKVIFFAAKLFKEVYRAGDILARTGGDEFTLILPKTTNNEANEIFIKLIELRNYYQKSIDHDEVHVSISFGLATKTDMDRTFNNVIKEAADVMYRYKLLQSDSIQSSIVNSMMASLSAKSQETEEHATRLISLSKAIGRRMQLLEEDLTELELLSILHDIGKIGIAENILNKPGKLDHEEWVEMRKHPEIGYKIAKSSPELSAIAEYILYHHERWDGSGYPHGLKGEEIPIHARILSVADAYDAMTEDRPYRKAMSHEKAMEELRVNSGTQFDPQVVDVFRKIVNNEKNREILE